MASFFFGRQIVLEILKSGQNVKRVLLAQGIDPQWRALLTELAQKKNVFVEQVGPRRLDSMVLGNHQGAVVEVESLRPMEFKTYCQSIPASFKGFLCLLDEIQDPQNLGATLRSAVCFDCSAVIVPNRRSSPLSAAVMRASSGAMAKCPLVEVANLGVAIERLQEKGFFVVGADPTVNTFLEETSLSFPLALVLGNEHRGIKPMLKKNCDALLSIRQSPNFDSLNVSCAATVFFHAVYQQMGKK